MKIEATFIGKDSLGYSNNRRYTLIVNGSTIKRESGLGVCKYQSVEAFLKNWKDIKVLQ